MIPEDIVVLGGTAWSDEVNQPPLQMVRALSRHCRVLYVYRETQGSFVRSLVRPRERGDRKRALRQVFRRSRLQQVNDRLWLAPLHGLAAVLPLSYPEPVRRLTLALTKQHVDSSIARIGFTNCTFWFYWWFYPELTLSPRAAFRVYDCIDQHGAYPHNARLPGLQVSSRKLEEALLQAVDAAFFVSPQLFEEKHAATRNPCLCPNGIDLTVADAALALRTPVAGMASLPRPLIGYAGDVGTRVDWQLVRSIATRHPRWSFVFAGGEAHAAVPLLPNVHVLPSRPYPQMLRTIRDFDVAVLPMADNPFNRGTSPMKLLDYMITGRPIVAHPLPAIVALAREAPGTLRTATTVDEWSAALQASLAEPPGGAPEALRIATARHHSTLAREQAMLAYATGVFDRKYGQGKGRNDGA